MFGISLFKEVSFFFKDITHNSNFSHLYTEMPEKERVWLLLIFINLTYTRIGFVSLIYRG